MTMLRRYEVYVFDPKASAQDKEAMDRSMRHAQRWIPEVLHSALGYNRSPTGLDLVWEHAFESTEAYKRYMIHPFHANIYDRYLLCDSPERIVVNAPYDVLLLGFSCDRPTYFLPSGYARRVALVRLEPGSEGKFKQITEREKAANPDMLLSLLAENTFATRWMDGVTQIVESTTYTHIWEQGYRTLAEAEAASTAWQGEGADIIETSVELWYELATGDGYDKDDPLASSRTLTAEEARP